MAPNNDWKQQRFEASWNPSYILPSPENEHIGIGHLGNADPGAARAGAVQVVASEADLLAKGLARGPPMLSSKEAFLRSRPFSKGVLGILQAHSAEGNH